MHSSTASLPRRRTLAWLASASCLPIACPAWAQSRSQVTLIVPFAAGGGPDAMARVLEPMLAERMGQTLVVDNRPGAGGMLGTTLAASAPPDGKTLILGGTSPYAVAPALNRKNARYDATRSFAHVGLVGRAPLVLVARTSAPYRTLAQLVSAAKSKPGDLTYGSPGIGTLPHLLGAMFVNGAGINVLHVPYKGGPQSMNALLGGEVQYMLSNIAPLSAQIKSGSLRPLAVSGSARSRALPEVPTFAELGLAGLDVEGWYVLSAPSNTPPDILQRLNQALNHALASPQMRQALEKEGVTPTPSTPDEAQRFVASEVRKWSQLVQRSGASTE